MQERWVFSPEQGFPRSRKPRPGRGAQVCEQPDPKGGSANSSPSLTPRSWASSSLPPPASCTGPRRGLLMARKLLYPAGPQPPTAPQTSGMPRLPSSSRARSDSPPVRQVLRTATLHFPRTLVSPQRAEPSPIDHPPALRTLQKAPVDSRGTELERHAYPSLTRSKAHPKRAGLPEPPALTLGDSSKEAGRPATQHHLACPFPTCFPLWLFPDDTDDSVEWGLRSPWTR